MAEYQEVVFQGGPFSGRRAVVPLGIWIRLRHYGESYTYKRSEHDPHVYQLVDKKEKQEAETIKDLQKENEHLRAQVFPLERQIEQLRKQSRTWCEWYHRLEKFTEDALSYIETGTMTVGTKYLAERGRALLEDAKRMGRTE